MSGITITFITIWAIAGICTIFTKNPKCLSHAVDITIVIGIGYFILKLVE